MGKERCSRTVNKVNSDVKWVSDIKSVPRIKYVDDSYTKKGYEMRKREGSVYFI